MGSARSGLVAGRPNGRGRWNKVVEKQGKKKRGLLGVWFGRRMAVGVNARVKLARLGRTDGLGRLRCGGRKCAECCRVFGGSGGGSFWGPWAYHGSDAGWDGRGCAEGKASYIFIHDFYFPARTSPAGQHSTSESCLPVGIATKSSPTTTVSHQRATRTPSNARPGVPLRLWGWWAGRF